MATRYALRDRSSMKRKYAEDDEDGEVKTQDDDMDWEHTTVDDLEYHTGKKMKADSKRTSTRKKSRKRQPFRFLDLPAELRLTIYDYATSQDHLVPLITADRDTGAYVRRGYSPKFNVNPSELEKEFSDRGRRPRKTLSPGLLRVCRQIHDEVAPIIYGKHLIFQSTETLTEFLMQIDPGKKTLLKHITIMHWAGMRALSHSINRTAFYMLQGATALQVINLECDLGCVWGLENRIKQFYSAARPFIEAYGKAHGSISAALDIFKIKDDNFGDTHLHGVRYYPWRTPPARETPLQLADKKVLFKKKLCEMFTPPKQESGVFSVEDLNAWRAAPDSGKDDKSLSGSM